MTNNRNNEDHTDMHAFDGSEPGPPPHDELDAKLRQWHDDNAGRAAAGRDRLLRALAQERAETEVEADRSPSLRFARSTSEVKVDGRSSATSPQTSPANALRTLIMHPYSRLAASFIVLVALVTLFLPTPGSQAFAQDGIIMVPDGGRLEAHDEDGNLVGPCPLEHTDVNVEISGFFSRVTVTQSYQNPYDNKIEAVYTFPLSHRAAVDRMTMTVGDRVVQGEVKEREKAKQIYQAAREQGYVASLLEQERPNIFTQSVANIEPGAKIEIEISYVEILESKDGEYTFDFPMVVGPRYIPGAPMTSPALAPAELTTRRGVILLGPANLTIGAAGEPGELGTLQTGKLHTLLGSAQPIQYPDNAWWGAGDESGGAQQPTLWHRFQAEYCDGSKEFGELYTDGTGWINGRWFYTDPKAIKDTGTGFSTDTNQVPDASRITPEPVRPGKRAGHDISVTVKLDTGGPHITALRSTLHEIRGDEFLSQRHWQQQATIILAEKNEIPNRDFALSWKTNAQAIEEAKLTHAGEKGGFFTLILNPPDRVEDADIPPRELVFVMDTSGSMRGFPINKSKEVISKAIDAMRPTDTFNVITFAGRTAVLWSESKPANEQYRAEAQNFINNQQGGGGTEMMKAIDAALVQADNPEMAPIVPAELLSLAPDGQRVIVDVTVAEVEREGRDRDFLVAGGESRIPVVGFEHMPGRGSPWDKARRLSGTWTVHDNAPTLMIEKQEHNTEPAVHTPSQVPHLPAWGQYITLSAPYGEIQHAQGDSEYQIAVRDDLALRLRFETSLPTVLQPDGVNLRLRGNWMLEDGKRIFIVRHAALYDFDKVTSPMRIVLFLTDGYVGNDMAIVDAVRKNAHTTRVFSFGIGNSVNRYLLDGMAKAGRGEAEFVLLESDSDAAVERFTKRVETPVLTDINLAFSDGLEITDTIPPIDQVRDLFDVEPLIIHGRYSQPGVGTLTITGNTGAGPYQRVLDLELHEQQAEHDVIATLWARAKVEQILNSDLQALQQNAFPAEKKQQVVALGEEFQIMTQYTSFVAVEKSRTTIEGQPVLVAVPIEMPSGVSYEGIFGDIIQQAGREIFLGAQLQMIEDRQAIRDGAYPASRTFGLADNLSADETEERARIMQDEGGQIKDVANTLRAQNQRGHVEYEADMQRAQERLTQGAYAEAANVALTARIRLNQDRQFLTEDDFRSMADAAETLLDEINAGRGQARIDSGQEARTLVDKQNRREAQQREQARQQMIDENIRRVRQLQMELKYPEALQVLEQTLFIDEHNVAALALKEVITAVELYRRSDDIRRAKDWSYTQQWMDSQRSSIAPSVNYGSRPGNLSTNAILEYPRDWSELSLRRTSEGGWRDSRADQLGMRSNVRLEHADPAKVVQQAVELLERSGTRADVFRRQRGLQGFDISAPGGDGGGTAGEARASGVSEGAITFPWQSDRSERITGALGEKVGIVALPEQNAVAITGPPEYRAAIRELIGALDAQAGTPLDKSGNMRGRDGGAEQEQLLAFSADLRFGRPADGKVSAGYLSSSATESNRNSTMFISDANAPWDLMALHSKRTDGKAADGSFVMRNQLSIVFGADGKKIAASEGDDDVDKTGLTPGFFELVSPGFNADGTIAPAAEGWFNGKPDNTQGSTEGDDDLYSMEARAKFILSGNVVSPDWIRKITINNGSPAGSDQADSRAGAGEAWIGESFRYKNAPALDLGAATMLGDEFRFNSAPALDLDAALNQGGNGGGGFGGGGSGGRGGGGFGGGGSAGVRNNLGLASGSDASVFGAIAETDEDQRLSAHEALKRAVEIMAYRNAAIELGEAEATAFDDDETPGDAQPQADVAAGVAPAGEPTDDIESAPAEAAPKAASPSISLIEILFAHAGRPLLAPELVILINTFTQEGDIEVARQLAEELAAVLPQYEVAVKLHETFTSEELDDAQRAEAVAQLAAQAHAQMIATINAVLLYVRIENVLDERLRPFAAASGFPEELGAGIYDGPTPMDTEWVDGGILLTVKIENLDDAVIERLEEYAKLVVKTTVERDSFIVGVVPLGRLDDLALIPEVVWVEPARVTPNDG